MTPALRLARSQRTHAAFGRALPRVAPPAAGTLPSDLRFFAEAWVASFVALLILIA